MADSTPAAKLRKAVSDQDHIRGNPDAKFVLVEYGDYECEYCHQVHPIVDELRSRMGGRLQYVFRHFPISSLHPHARLAAQAAEAAGNQGKFWELHDLMFTHTGTLSEDVIFSFAEKIGLDMDQFHKDLEREENDEKIENNFMSGVRSGVNGTPTFFLNGKRYNGAWDLESLQTEIYRPPAVQIRQLFQQFTQIQASGGIVLLLATIVALIMANSPLVHMYHEFWESSFSLVWGNNFELSEHLLEWVNDGLMVLFFFVVGLEIKREILVGELASPKKAALPIMAAVGGMIVPALFYLLFNFGGPAENGWGISMATDIAFTLGILTVLRSRVPLSLKVFFAALAIADDLGAVLVIAIFYSEGIVWGSLAIGGVFLLALLAINRAEVRHPLPYALLGIGLWLAFLESGVHPTIAGVLLALTIPARGAVKSRAFLAQCISVLDDFPEGNNNNTNSQKQAAVQTLERIAERIQTPAQRLENTLTPWSTYLVLPIFALANAGVQLSDEFLTSLASPVSLGIITGLVIGKPLGITLFSWLAVKLKIAELPWGVNWKQIFGASFLAGIGFTMSLFIAGAAFEGALLEATKGSILVASIIAAIIGVTLITLTSSPKDQFTQM